MKYRIHSRTNPGVEITAGVNETRTLIVELSGRGSLSDGRGFADYILGQIGRVAYGRKRESVYVATNAASPGRALLGRGFLVERVR